MSASFVIPEPRRSVLPIHGADGLFPVRRVYCVGRNYAAHAREMGADPDREPPFFFSKPGDAVVPGGQIPYPPATADLHHEVELVVAIGRTGTAVRPAEAQALIYGFAVGVDLTRRDLQTEAKKGGKPWDMAKGFDNSAPVGALVPLDAYPLPEAAAIILDVDGQRRQAGDLADMIWSVPEVIAHLSGLVTLEPGDLIFTGTPEGVGPLERGAVVRAEVAGLPLLAFTLV
ncbi:fumarylacetoacetate hydrolase family protein [Novispirillum sp. DQ9]|uniref:fumarylacetoacetate hydrolase family protein n=1 Tax=Novispirillum sp. DQ9 TaxID=3398612 RepID=UPI003C79ECCB